MSSNFWPSTWDPAPMVLAKMPHGGKFWIKMTIDVCHNKRIMVLVKNDCQSEMKSSRKKQKEVKRWLR